MRLSLRLLMSAAVVTGFTSAVQGADDIPTLDVRPFLTGQAPQGLSGPTPPSAAEQAERAAKAASALEKQSAASGAEKQSAINGTLYAVVAPTYNNPNATLSYIRLFNGAAGPSNFSITIIGSPTGRNYGTANIQVGRSASPQYSLTQILANANAGALTGGDTSYSLYIQNPDAMSGFQHVTYNAVSKFFENSSVCSSLLNQAVAANSSSAVLTNVHTTRIAEYPSQVELHNFWNAAVTYRVTILDSDTGTVRGTVNVPTAPNASYSIPMSSLESQSGWAPTATQFHANLVVTDPSGGPPYNMLGQSIVNSQLAASINMSTTCAVNATTSSYAGGPGLNGY
jgi:hypothetical protein